MAPRGSENESNEEEKSSNDEEETTADKQKDESSSHSKHKKSKHKRKKSKKKSKKSSSRKKHRNRSRSRSRETDSERESVKPNLKEKSDVCTEQDVPMTSYENEKSLIEQATGKPRSRSQEKSKSMEKSNERTKGKERSISRSRSRSKGRSKSKERSRSKDRSRSQESSKAKDSLKSRERSRSKDRSRSRDRSRFTKKSRSRSRSRSKERLNLRKKSKERSKSKEKQKSTREISRSPDQSRSRKRRSQSHGRSKDRSRSKGRSKSKDRSRKKSKSQERSKRVIRSRSKGRSRSRSLSRERSSKQPRQASKNRSRSRDKSRTRRSPERSPRRQRSRGRSRSRSHSRDRWKYPRYEDNRNIRRRFRSRDRQRWSRNYRRSWRSRSRSYDRFRRRSRSRSPRSSRYSDRKRHSEKSPSKPKCGSEEPVAASVPINLSIAMSSMTTTVTASTAPKPVPETKSIADFTALCKKLTEDGEESIEGAKTDHGDEAVSHPFQVRPRKDIVIPPVIFPVSQPKLSTEPNKPLEQAFPVSSGSQHKTKEDTKGSAVVEGVDGSVTAAEEVFKTISQQEKLDVSDLIAKRLDAQNRLLSNPNDFEAKLVLEEVQLKLQNWASVNLKPGQFTGENLVQNLLPKESINSGYQAWAKKDMFHNLAPLRGGVGMMLLAKMGWKPGQVLGKRGEGNLEPIALNVKMDRKGLTSYQETNKGGGKKPSAANQVAQGKHPVSALSEYCTKKKWNQPVYNVVHESGPSHKKNFVFQVVVNGYSYQYNIASNNKKLAKAQCAFVALKSLGVVPQDAVL